MLRRKNCYSDRRRGIGRHCCRLCQGTGAHVVGIDICEPVFPKSGVKASTIEDFEETGRQVKAEGQRWQNIKLDQRNLPALQEAALQIEKEFGGIDIIFANAGIQEFCPLLELKDDDWNIHINVNLTGTANALRAFSPYLIKRGKGRIIVTTSTQGWHGTKYGAAYSAFKWGG